ncbi:MAG: hypothetical protein WB628_07695, partial [Candidatus Sulfotelmatobacter sp.]
MTMEVRAALVFLGLTALGVGVFLAPGTAWAQGETTSAIVGQVSDTTRALIPGATVTIINRETGLR